MLQHLIIMLAALILLIQIATAVEPTVGDVLTDGSSPVGQRVQGKGRPAFVDDEGRLVFKGWTRQSHGHWDYTSLSYAQSLKGVNCCVNVFAKDRSLILAISQPISRLPNGRVASEVLTFARRFDLAPHEGWQSGCVDGGHMYELAIVNKTTGRARVIDVDGSGFREKTIALKGPMKFDGSECSDPKALN